MVKKKKQKKNSCLSYFHKCERQASTCDSGAGGRGLGCPLSRPFPGWRPHRRPNQTHPPPHRAAGTCGDASPPARSLSAGLTESEMPLSSSAGGASSLSESDPQVESHSSMVLGSLNRQLPSKFPIETVTQRPSLILFSALDTLHIPPVRSAPSRSFKWQKNGEIPDEQGRYEEGSVPQRSRRRS